MNKPKLVVILLLTIVPIGIWFVTVNKDGSIINDSNAQLNNSDSYVLDEIIIDEENEETMEEDEIKSSDIIDTIKTDDSVIDEEKLTKYDSQNGIEMSVMLQKINDDNDEIVFRVLINNHGIDLEKIPYEKIARLITNEGKIIDKGFVWESNGSGHHISGNLKLPKNDDVNGSINKDLDYLELEFTDLGNADKLSFKWDKEILDLLKDEYLAYVPNAGDGYISVIDISTNKVIDEIQIGEAVSHGISTSSDGSKIYTGKLRDGKILIVDVKSKEVIKTIDTGRNLHGIDITPNGKYLFATSGDLKEGEEFNFINIIDTKKDEIIKTIESNGKSPTHIDFTKDSKLAFINNVMSGDIAVVDIDEFKILSTIDVGTMPNESEISPDDKYLYVANVQDNTVSIVDIKQGKEIDKIKAGEGTHGIAISNDGKYLWTTNRFSKDISVIDIEKKEVIKTIKSGGQANHISILPNSDLAYVSNLESEDISVIDMKSYEVINTIKIGKDPHEIEFIKII